MLTIVEKVICLQHVDVFSELPTEQLSYLAAIAEEVSYSPGDDVFRCDEFSDALYVVLSGELRATVENAYAELEAEGGQPDERGADRPFSPGR